MFLNSHSDFLYYTFQSGLKHNSPENIPRFSPWHYCFIGQGYFEYSDKSLKDYIVT